MKQWSRQEVEGSPRKKFLIKWLYFIKVRYELRISGYQRVR